MSIYDNATILLRDVDELLREQYLAEVPQTVYVEGNVTNRLIQPSSEAVFGDGKNVQTVTRYGSSMGLSNQALAAFPTPQAFDAGEYKVRFSSTNTSANDFTRVAGSARVDHYTLMNGSGGAALDVAAKVFRDLTGDYNLLMATVRHADRTGQIALVNGTPKQNNSHRYAAATAYSAGGTTMRICIDNGPLAAFQPGTRWDIYSSAGVLKFSDARVTDFNAADDGATPRGSIGFERTSTDSTANFDNVADNDVLVRHGEQGQIGVYSLGAWFSRPTSSDSFIGGVNRSTAANRYLMTLATREGAASQSVISFDHFSQFFVSMNAVVEDNQVFVAVAHPSITRSLMAAAEGSKFLVTFNDAQATRARQFYAGLSGIGFQDPLGGLIALESDPLCPNNRVRIVRPGDWRCFYYQKVGLQPVPGSDIGSWYRVQGDVPNQGKGLAYQYDAFSNVCDICLNPPKQGEILNVKGTDAIS